MLTDKRHQVAKYLDRHDAGPQIRWAEKLFNLLMDHRSHINKLHSLEADAPVVQSFIELLMS